jgi:hypothetical protein
MVPLDKESEEQTRSRISQATYRNVSSGRRTGPVRAFNVIHRKYAGLCNLAAIARRLQRVLDPKLVGWSVVEGAEVGNGVDVTFSEFGGMLRNVMSSIVRCFSGELSLVIGGSCR